MGAFIAPVVAAGPPAKATNLSSKPLKSFNWVKLAPIKIKDTVWEKIDDNEIHKKLKKSSVYMEFEDLFAAKEVVVKEVAENKESEEAKEITFLDGKRSQNISNMLNN
jgi:dishevelled associated activator of morphogenesis